MMRVPGVPTDEEIRRFCDTVFKSERFEDTVVIKTFLYTGVRIRELINIRLSDVNLDACQIRITANKERVVQFPSCFQQTLSTHHQSMRRKKAIYLFEASRKRKYSERRVRKLLKRYASKAGLDPSISPHRLRHFFLLWLKDLGIDDV